MAVKMKLNTTEAIRDFKNYDRKTDKRFDRTLDKTANQLRSTQYGILRQKVIKWTGKLANSIKVDKKGKKRSIGPEGIKYASWIESGGKYGFFGYKYIMKSMKKHKRPFEKNLKKDIERAV